MKEIKNKTKLISITVIILAIACSIYVLKTSIFSKNEAQKQLNYNTQKTESNEFFSYLSVDNLVSVSKTEAPFDFTASQLKTLAGDCGVNNDIAYFDKLVSKFSGSSKITYSFKYNGNSQGDGVFKVTVLQNKAGYTSVDQFKKDFDICSAGGDAYPQLVNKNWLLFVSSCGSGFDDGSGRVNGCDEVQKIIEPSLRLN